MSKFTVDAKFKPLEGEFLPKDAWLEPVPMQVPALYENKPQLPSQTQERPSWLMNPTTIVKANQVKS